MFLIATDEAGYGPKLGPLVIVATVWKVPPVRPEPESLQALFSAMAATACPGDRVVTVDDSKRVFRQGEGLETLHQIVSAGLRWCEATELVDAEEGFLGQLAYLCQDDLEEILRTPWFVNFDSIPPADEAITRTLIDNWSSSGIRLIGAKARMISPRQLNDACEGGFNKADLLSGATLELVSHLVPSLPNSESNVQVYCDRHGGRRYYAGPLQHCFPDWMLQVMAESKQQSSYRLIADGLRLDVHFTVKGDRFTPVAFSSLIAKYLRERMMQSLNAYFAHRYHGDEVFRPTAGYPVDADRFLRQVETIRQREKIGDVDFVRSR